MQSKGADPRVAVALIYTGAMLTLLEYRYLPSVVQERVAGGDLLDAATTWVAACVVGFLVVPVSLLLLRREPLSEHGFRARGFFRHILVYLGLYAAMVPVLLIVSRRPEFLQTYPFVRSARTDNAVLVRWEIAYLLQFFALEAFFRGSLLFTLEKRLGTNAIFVMAVPYCMIHYHKPMPEALGALGAGVLLGALALRYRSFYGGVILHGLVAVTMDLLAVARFRSGAG